MLGRRLEILSHIYQKLCGPPIDLWRVLDIHDSTVLRFVILSCYSKDLSHHIPCEYKYLSLNCRCGGWAISIFAMIPPNSHLIY